jgi:hypothetical protein
MFMYRKLGLPDVRVAIAGKNTDVQQRIAEMQPRDIKTPRERDIAVYSQATYLKFRSAVTEFSAAAFSLSEWEIRREVALEDRRETVMLLEAYAGTADTERVVGALLLRSGWSNDVVIDFLVVDSKAAKELSSELHPLGPLLIYAAAAIAYVSGAKVVMAETAKHTSGYWMNYLPQGNALWRMAETEVAFDRAANIISEGGWVPDYANAE